MESSVMKKVPIKNKKKEKKSFKKRLKKNWPFLVMISIPLVFLLIFSYGPMYGIQIAFKDYSPGRGIMESEWNNFEHFKRMFTDYTFIRALKNTLNISFWKILVGFPAPILFALFLNELRSVRFKKVVQTVSYLPYFMSWVIVASMVVEVFSPQRGIVNTIISALGGSPIHFLASEKWFVPILIGTDIWKEIGYGAIIYLAAMTGINPDLYEAADLDGATRFHKMRYITIPSIMPIIITMLILKLGTVLNAGFDQVLNLYNPSVYSVGDIIDTYVYRIGLVNFSFDYSTAVGLFQNAIGLILITVSNWFTTRTTGRSIL